jgi:hypothetical protein
MSGFVTFEKHQPINTGGDCGCFFISDTLLVKSPDYLGLATGVLFVNYEDGIELVVGTWSGEQFHYNGDQVLEKQIEWCYIKEREKDEI